MSDRFWEAVQGRARQGEGAWTRWRLPTFPPVIWLTSQSVTQQALSLILFAILAPILGPHPYGVFAIVMIFVGFCEAILLDGAIEALVTVEQLDHKHTITANLANSVAAMGFALAVSAAAPWIATALQDPEIRNVIWALAPLPVLSTLSAAPIAVLRRSLKYRELAIRSMTGLIVGGVVGLALAVAGAGVWALVAQVLAQRIAELWIAWIAVPVRFGFGWSAPHFRELRPVALNVFTARIMGMANGNLPRLALGYTAGAATVGLYAMGSRFLDIIVNTTTVPRTAVGRIELRGAKLGSLEFERIFTSMVRNASILSFPCSLGFAALVPDLFHLWLDKQWQAGVVPAQLIVLTCAPMVFFYSLDAALLAANLSGTCRKIANLQGASVAVTVICAAPFGLTITCLALALRPWLLLPVVLTMFHRATGISKLKVLSPSLRPLIGSVIMATILTLPLAHPSWIPGALLLSLQTVAGIVFYMSFMYIFAPGDIRPFLPAALQRG